MTKARTKKINQTCNHMCGSYSLPQGTCPACQKTICCRCMITDLKGDGSYVFCPHCQQKVILGEVIATA